MSKNSKQFLKMNVQEVRTLEDYKVGDMGEVPPEVSIENMVVNKVEDYVVCVRFSETDYTATDAMRDYLRKIAELKY